MRECGELRTGGQSYKKPNLEDNLERFTTTGHGIINSAEREQMLRMPGRTSTTVNQRAGTVGPP